MTAAINPHSSVYWIDGACFDYDWVVGDIFPAMKTALLITLILGGLLALAIGTSVYLWWQLEDVEVGVVGTVALNLGIAFTFAMWVGLMWLMYHSRKRGHDDNVG